MCLGIPMRIVETDGAHATCEGRGEQRRVDVRLIESPAVGDWLLVFHAVGRERLTEQRAQEVGSALDALEAAFAGEVDLDRHFADLAGREPQLPEHLRKEPKRD